MLKSKRLYLAYAEEYIYIQLPAGVRTFAPTSVPWLWVIVGTGHAEC